jgi:hypothetical protein
MSYYNDAWIYDWEVYRNMACVAFININSNPRALEAYRVVDIEFLRVKRLLANPDISLDDEIEYDRLLEDLIARKNKLLELLEVRQFTIFYDKDPSKRVCELYQIVEFFSVYKVLFGYNSVKYDSVITDYVLCTYKKYNYQTGFSKDNIHICQELKDVSDSIISFQDTGTFIRNYAWKPKYYKRLFKDYDIQKILYLDKAFIGLKSVAINLKWHRIQELPIHHTDFITPDTLNVIKDYNINDILITLELVKSQTEELDLRDKISNRYTIDCRNDSRSSIGKKLMIKYYSEYSGMDYSEFEQLRTYRGNMRLSSIIDPKIKFKTDKLREFLTKLRQKVISPGDEFEEQISLNNTYYKIAKGGIHSIDDSAVYDAAADNCLYIDADVKNVAS